MKKEVNEDQLCYSYTEDITGLVITKEESERESSKCLMDILMFLILMRYIMRLMICNTT